MLSELEVGTIGVIVHLQHPLLRLFGYLNATKLEEVETRRAGLRIERPLLISIQVRLAVIRNENSAALGLNM
jgi:hypothetical protein